MVLKMMKSFSYSSRPMKNQLTVYYKDNKGNMGEQMLFRSDEARLSIGSRGAFMGLMQTASILVGLEAYHISQAALFDPMMAVYSSNVEPLPHQISAVYETMLPKQPLRFVLADDPGEGRNHYGRLTDS